MTMRGTAAAWLRALALSLFDLRSAWAAAFWYGLATVAMTWPLAATLRQVVPFDLVDPLLNCWILAWVSEHLLAALGGDLGALGSLWHANMFHPEPYALGYSEHLFAQALQALPVYALTRDLLLSYNLLYLSTWLLSGLGCYLLVRELSGDSRAAFVAGLLFAFALCRSQQLGHLQVLSSQWMPFVFYGLRRFFDRGGLRALAGASAAMVLQNLSCGYYLLYFPPFVASYVIYEMADRGLLRDRRTWLALGLAALAVLALGLFFLAEARVAPFEIRRLEWTHGGARPAAGVPVPRDTPGIYRHLAALPPDAVVAELPFGRPEDEARYLYYSTLHWRRLVNGYSGGFPRSYRERLRRLGRPLDNPDQAWLQLADDGVGAVVLHQWAYAGDEGATVREWLLEGGARPVAADGADILFLLPR